MTEKTPIKEFPKFDVAEHLDSLECVKAYLQEFMNNDTEEELKEAIKDVMRSKWMQG